MKKTFLMVVAAALALSTVCFRADAEEEKESEGAKDTLTVITPDAGGGVTVLSKERPAKKRPRKKDKVAADTSPRKARIIVVPAIFSQELRSRSRRELNELFGISDPSILENPGFTSFIVDALVNCRKFDVLEREDLRSVTKELDFGESEYADAAKVVRIGKALNADYAVIPEIQFLEFRMGKAVPYIGAMAKRLEGRMDVNMRTVEVGTSRLVSSHMFSTKVRKSKRQSDSVQAWFGAVKGDVYRQAAMESVARTIDTVYPLRVVTVRGNGTCVVNRGRGAMEAGETMEVFEIGELMIDPDTGDNLGFDEIMVGKIKATNVRAKTSEAKVLEGKVSKGNVCRRTGKAGAVQLPVLPIE